MFPFFSGPHQEPDTTTILTGKNVLITGGTGGIGAAVAVAFAKRGANIYLAGRKADAANQVLEKCKSKALEAGRHHDRQEFQFFQFDASSIKDCIRFSQEVEQVFSAQGGLHFLVLSHGGMGNGTRKETEEGHEWFLVTHSFSRYIIGTKLLPVLKQSGKGVVLNVLSGAVWNSFDENNLELVGVSPNFLNVASRDGPLNDVFALESNERHPEVIYNHVFPGAVKSDLANSNKLGYIMGFGFDLVVRALGQSAEHYSEVAFKIATTWYRPGGESEPHRFWGASGEKRFVKDYPSRLDVRARVMETVERETGIKM